MNANIKLKLKLENSALKSKKKSKRDSSRTQINQQKINTSQPKKQINLDNKNPLFQSICNKNENLSDRKSSMFNSKDKKKISNIDSNKTGNKTTIIKQKSRKLSCKRYDIQKTQSHDKKNLSHTKQQTKVVKNIFQKNYNQDTVEKNKRNLLKSQKPLTGAQKYTFQEIAGNGTFGIVYKGRNKLTLEIIAIKKVLQNPKYKNRQHQILKQLDHINVLKIKDSFFTIEKNQKFLNVIMDYYPETAYSIIRKFNKNNPIPSIIIKIYAYQIFRGLLYLDKINICHRDIKPHNILIDSRTNQLVICDFGSAKCLVVGQSNISYICSRCYRAPQLIFGSTEYTTKIDMWSVGCVILQMIMFHPIFFADSNIDQLVQIVKILGTPSEQQIISMNPKYNLKDFNFPKINSKDWKKIIKAKIEPELINLIAGIMKYNPKIRLSPFEALCHPYFDELRDKTKLNNYKLEIPIPQLFKFTKQQCTKQELQKLDRIQSKLQIK